MPLQWYRDATAKGELPGSVPIPTHLVRRLWAAAPPRSAAVQAPCSGGGDGGAPEQPAAPSCSAGSGRQDEQNVGQGAAVQPEHVSGAREAAVVGLVALASLNQARRNAAGQACGGAVPTAGQKRTSSGGLVHPLPALNAAAQELLQLVSTRAEARAAAEAFRREHPNQRMLSMPAAEGPVASLGERPAANCARAGTSAPLRHHVCHQRLAGGGLRLLQCQLVRQILQGRHTAGTW